MTRRIDNTEDLGRWIRAERKAQGLRQPDLAAAAATSVRFIVEIERGKPTAQIGKVLDVLRQLGIGLSLEGLSEGPGDAPMAEADPEADLGAGPRGGGSPRGGKPPGEGS